MNHDNLIKLSSGGGESETRTTCLAEGILCNARIQPLDQVAFRVWWYEVERYSDVQYRWRGPVKPREVGSAYEEGEAIEEYSMPRIVRTGEFRRETETFLFG